MNKFAAVILFPLCVALAGCSQPTIPDGDLAEVEGGYTRMVQSLGEGAKGKGFEMALYRAVSPTEFVEPGDAFETIEPLKLATDRGEMPAPGSPAYLKVIQEHAPLIAGMDADVIVDKYVSHDSAVLNKQEAWARRWQTRNRLKTRNDGDEVERRRRLLRGFSAQQASYSWEGGRPLLKFLMRNPLDVPLDRIELDFDLFDAQGQGRVGSARVQGILGTALQPEAVASVQIDLSQYEHVARREFRNIGETLNVQLAFRNAWSKERSLIFADPLSDQDFTSRNALVVDLLRRIETAKENLSKYRIMFAER